MPLLLPENVNEKRESEQLIESWNAELEAILRGDWDLQSGLRRLGLRQIPGIKPKWSWNPKDGKLSRSTLRGGIDWFRYHTRIPLPKLLLFALECLEDKPPSHTYQQNIFNNVGV